MERKSFDNKNKYDFYREYYMKYEIGDIVGFIEINQKDYKELNGKLKTINNSIISTFVRYSVGFYRDDNAYVIQNVDEDIFYCLYKSQRYEENKRRHEKERHLDSYFNQENINNIADNYDIEEIVLNRDEQNRLNSFLSNVLSEKQKNRFYKNKIEEIPLVLIALEEGSTPDAIRDSVNKAKLRIKKNLKKF